MRCVWPEVGGRYNHYYSLVDVSKGVKLGLILNKSGLRFVNTPKMGF